MADTEERGGREGQRHAGATGKDEQSHSPVREVQGDRRAKRSGADIMRGRSFAGQNVANTERGQTRDRERVARGEMPDEAGEMVTDSEVEARISRRAERYED